ncbi:uncharacterized protein N7498_002436 [Penicillium cinerascens]|uniref:Acylphosphatase-like domain-containing protein n=1 Tax=Penicillium cinerascens TaxID=70096 RepID=A0A9W9NA44_9EURO|nr:uncharacterized protein N7498_002436 [Penicillium cinerascens]KAJ5216029.1 hypothetical protein N7498_002436 [Penicillium cinerascens]
MTTQRVEGEVQGDEESMRNFLQQINKGPRTAHVAKIEKKELEPHEHDDSFVVLRTAESMFHSGS